MQPAEMMEKYGKNAKSMAKRLQFMGKYAII
jgi:hypothetical protein